MTASATPSPPRSTWRNGERTSVTSPRFTTQARYDASSVDTRLGSRSAKPTSTAEIAPARMSRNAITPGVFQTGAAL